MQLAITQNEHNQSNAIVACIDPQATAILNPSAGTIPVRDDGDFGRGDPRADKAFCGGVEGRHWGRILSCSNRLAATRAGCHGRSERRRRLFAIVGMFLGGIAGPFAAARTVSYFLPICLGPFITSLRCVGDSAGSVVIFTVPRDPRSIDKCAAVSLSGASTMVTKSYASRVAYWLMTLQPKSWISLVYAGNALGIFVQGMSPLGCQRAQQNVGWHDALLAVVVVSYGKLFSGKRSDSAPGQSTPTASVRLRLTAEAGQRIGYYTRARVTHSAG
jgi:hypothetical protein